MLTDRYVSEGVERGAIGYIVEVYADGFEVEFSDRDGITVAQIVAKESDLENAE